MSEKDLIEHIRALPDNAMISIVQARSLLSVIDEQNETIQVLDRLFRDATRALEDERLRQQEMGRMWAATMNVEEE